MDKRNTEIKNKITLQVLSLFEQGYPFRANVCEVYCSVNPPKDTLIVDFEVVGICQNPALEIKAIEPIRIEIYKNRIPKVFVLREDFPSVPHLMCSADGKTKFLCYSDVSDEELRLRMNGRFLLECVNNWFVKTARNELHHPDQPLEPFFLGNKGVLITKSSFMKLDCIFNKFLTIESNLLMQVADDTKDKNTHWYATLWLCLPASADNVIRKLPTTLLELFEMYGNTQMFKYFEKQVREIWKVRQNPKLYESIFNNSAKSLLDCKCLIALYIPLYENDGAEIKKHDIRVFKLCEPYSQLLQMIGLRYNSMNKKLEPFAIQKSVDASIEMFQLQCDFDSALAGQLNGIDNNNATPHIALVGVGALGSQIFANCIRAGFGKWTLA